MTIDREKSKTENSDNIVLRLYTSYLTKHSPARPWDEEDEENDRRLESEMREEAIKHVMGELDFTEEKVRAALERKKYLT